LETDFDATRAFPAEVSADNIKLIERIAASSFLNIWQEPDVVLYQGTELALPYRVYYTVDVVDRAMSIVSDGAVVAACLGSRSNDGYLRQRSVELLVSQPRPWSVPYMVEALGDYVVQILEVMDGRLPKSLEPAFGEYLVANQDRFLRLSRRCVSYSTEYYRRTSWNSYPGSRVIAELVAMGQSVDQTFGSGLRGILPKRKVR